MSLAHSEPWLSARSPLPRPGETGRVGWEEHTIALNPTCLEKERLPGDRETLVAKGTIVGNCHELALKEPVTTNPGTCVHRSRPAADQVSSPGLSLELS